MLISLFTLIKYKDNIVHKPLLGANNLAICVFLTLLICD